MRVAVIGASGKTGTKLLGEVLRRGHEAVGVCRENSAAKLDEFSGRDGFALVAGSSVSDEAVLAEALGGCDVVVVVLISVRHLKATELVSALAKATKANGVTRLVFTAGEATAVGEPGEAFTVRQRLMRAIIPPLLWLTPYSMWDMLKASELVRQQPEWDWTIMRAPTLSDSPAIGYRSCKVSEISGKDILSREDYAACLIDSLDNPWHFGRALAVKSARPGQSTRCKRARICMSRPIWYDAGQRLQSASWCVGIVPAVAAFQPFEASPTGSIDQSEEITACQRCHQPDFGLPYWR